jgi:aspartyl-tRNA(Asn)/glutamyl-tRNA(Gln) amidotransferase subunit A
VSSLAELSLAEAASGIFERTVTSAQLVGAVLERIAETEGSVHAYAFVDGDACIATAARLDRELERGTWRGPLHGVPIALKDVIWTKDVPTEAGSRALAGHVPDRDATVVSRLRDAGAVIVGKSVTYEFAFGRNEPPTRCPWDLRCYPGGSSAGSGVAVSVRSAFGALGTDTGGSIRVPAAVNGVVGLKPSFGRVSRDGVVPLSQSLDAVGPLARTVEDCALILSAIAGADPRDPSTLAEPVPEYHAFLSGDIRDRRIGVDVSAVDDVRLTEESAVAFEAALETLRSLGAQVVEVEIPELRHAEACGLTLAFSEVSYWHRRLVRDHGGLYDAGTRAMIEVGFALTGPEVVAAQRMRELLKRAVRRAFEDAELDALVGPTLTGPTVPVDERHRLEGTHRLLIGANVTGLPAISVPCGATSTGLPLGLHLVGRPYAEAELLRIADAYERAARWTGRPPVLDADAPAAREGI